MYARTYNLLVWLLLLLIGVFDARAHEAMIDLKLAPGAGDPSSVTIEWFPAEVSGISAYRLTCADPLGIAQQWDLPGDVTRHTVSGLLADSTYRFEVTALNAVGESVASSPSETLTPDDRRVATAATSPLVPVGLDAILESCNSQNFPFLFVSMRVEENGVPRTDLPASDFSCFEDIRPQTDFFAVVPPAVGGGIRQADIVFLVDTSGSMGSEIAQVRQHVDAFAQALAASNIDFRLGLVKFGNADGQSNPFIFNSGALTNDITLLQGFVNSLRATGGFEPGFLAIRQAIATFQFRPGSQISFILITDEDSDDRNKIDTLNLLLANQITVHVAVDCNFGTSNADYCVSCNPDTDPLQNCSVRGATGGLLFPVLGDFGPILDTIRSQTASTYIVRYRTDNPNFDGLERSVECFVTDQGMSDFVTCSYIPGAAPIIRRTPETVALSDTAQVAGSTLTIAVDVTDAAAPFVTGVRLFSRRTGSGANFAPVLMQNQGGTRWAAQLPTGVVDTPGVDYYISATDGQVTSFDPSTEPALAPYQFAVLPNVAPSIVHTPVAQAAAGQPIEITAEMADSTNHLAFGELRWRRVGTLAYNPIRVDAMGSMNLTFAAAIPGDDVTIDGIEYYIVATDDLGVTSTGGSAGAPYRVEIVGIRLERVDPVSALLSGGQIILPEGSQAQSNLMTLATKGFLREGVGADGVARLILRIVVPGGGSVHLFLEDENGQPLTEPRESGLLMDLADRSIGNFLSVPTYETSRGHMAFAVYRSPSEFVRSGFAADAEAAERQVLIRPRFESSTGSVINSSRVAIKILRPPVLLVHGIWGDGKSWDHFSPLYTRNASGRGVTSDSRFFIEPADYGDFNASSFGLGAEEVYNDLKTLLRHFRFRKKVAAIQADVVTHSMGGPVVRTMALQERITRDPAFPTFGAGSIRRLVTIAGVHRGTRMANFLLDHPCLQLFFTAYLQKPTGSGAVTDMAEGSLALGIINHAAARTPFPVHTIVGEANDNQKLGANVILGAVQDLLPCPSIFPGVGAILGSNNDVLVPSASQRGGRAGPATVIPSVTHSDPFPEPRELRNCALPPTSVCAATRVIELLNTSEVSLFAPMP